jgi:16S rRNA (adenine1518-N6/adenine1519-N6)-dimethyltransferase
VNDSSAAQPKLSELIRQFELTARKSLGQNFLFDERLVERIANATGPLAGINVVEIGPGPGGLTRALLAAGAARVVAVERDPRCVEALQGLAANASGRLEIIAGDALKLDAASLVAAPRRLIANLPYNIATPLLLGWLKQIDCWQALAILLQKEVAQRITAAPGGKAYGRLSVITQWLCLPQALFDIPPGAFRPPPKVTSTLLGLMPRAEPLARCDFADLERVTAAAFGQRRKMLRASLKSLGVDAQALCEGAAIVPTARAEELEVEEFCGLARGYRAMVDVAA